ncbi:hypothetical protein [Streptomyces sp. NPDC001970]
MTGPEGDLGDDLGRHGGMQLVTASVQRVTLSREWPDLRARPVLVALARAFG